MLVSATALLKKAQRGRYAIGAFNIDNLEMVQAVIEAATSLKSPAIIATSESSIRYAGMHVLYSLIAAATKGPVPFVLHLDHGKDISLIQKCIKAGWTSVMYDGSLLSYEQNIKKTQTIASFAKKYNVSVEAELGALKAQEDGEQSKKSFFTDPAQASAFVRATNIDFLAIAIGTSHGAFKAPHTVKLDYARLAAIRKTVSVPLVLHGASTLSVGLQKKMHATCSKIDDCLRLEGAHGVSAPTIKKCIALGIAKVNVGTDLRASFVAGVRSALLEHTTSIDERDLLTEARDLVRKTVEERIRLFGSAGKA